MTGWYTPGMGGSGKGGDSLIAALVLLMIAALVFAVVVTLFSVF